MDSIRETLLRLRNSGVPHVLVGGLAARAHGSVVNTEDVDVCISPADEQFRKIVSAFMDVRPRYRMRPERPPLTPDHPWLTGVKNLYLITDVGQVGILGELPGIGTYEQIVPSAIEIDFDGILVRVLDIPTLIRSKEFAGRDKDRRAAVELKVILDRINARRPPG